LVSRSASTVTKQARSPIGASTTKGGQPFNAVGKRKTGQEFSKGTTIRIAIQSNQIQVLFQSVDGSFDKGNKTSEKLGFVNENDLILAQLLVREFVQRRYANTRNLSTVVCD
jgi:hypothetical protein